MESVVKRHFKVGSRKSQLALIQTEWVVGTLQKLHPDSTFEIVGFSTIGDKILNVALSKIGDKGLFTQELETALLNGEIDFVVHSLKDLPTQLPKGLSIAAISKREDPRDAVIFNSSLRSTMKSLQDLPDGSAIGTSSLRRIAQLKRRFPNLKFLDVRGNLNTRLQKLDNPEGPYSALILAAAGVNRMGWQDKIGQYLEWEDCMHAVGQGALGVECKEDNLQVIQILQCLSDPSTYFRCISERLFLRVLEGGCSVPVAVHSELKFDGNSALLTLRGSVWSLDGSKSVSTHITKNLNSSISENSLDDITNDLNLSSIYSSHFKGFEPESHSIAARVGIKLGHIVLGQGAKEILEEVKSQTAK